MLNKYETYECICPLVYEERTIYDIGTRVQARHIFLNPFTVIAIPGFRLNTEDNEKWLFVPEYIFFNHFMEVDS